MSEPSAILKRKQLHDQWQVALIWMRDANMAPAEKTPRGLLNRLAALSMAEFHLNKYFEMVEAHLIPTPEGQVMP